MNFVLKRGSDPSVPTSKMKMCKCSEENETEVINPELQSLVRNTLIVPVKELQKYLDFIENDKRIVYLLNADCCCRIADNYLLAMVFVYFKRANVQSHQYTTQYFFAALYLAHDMEEEDEAPKMELLKWALGPKWITLSSSFFAARDKIWNLMNFRAIVSRRLCNEIMDLLPEHYIWKRQRQQYHAGASRLNRFQLNSPFNCTQCLPIGRLPCTSQQSYLLVEE